MDVNQFIFRLEDHKRTEIKQFSDQPRKTTKSFEIKPEGPQKTSGILVRKAGNATLRKKKR